jgi:hypothetical protein
METEVMECRLTKVVCFFDSPTDGAGLQEVVNELRSCESELVSRRFARSTASDGRAIRVRVPAVDAALIHVSRALSLMGDGSHLEQAKESVEHAREEVAHIATA